MKNFLPALAIVVVMVWDFVMSQLSFLPRAASYVPDLVVFSVAGAAAARILATKRFNVMPLKYYLLFAIFCYSAAAAFVISGVSGDVVFAAVRTYLRYPALLLIGMAYLYTAEDVRFHLKLVMYLMLLQVPVTIWQRFFEFSHLKSGDAIVGTFSSSSTLAMLCSCAVLAVIALAVDKRISAAKALVLTLLMLIPAALSETKATPIFLIVGIGALLFNMRSSMRLRQLVVIGASVSIVLGVFIFAYDSLYKKDIGYLELITSDRMLNSYNFQGSKASSFTEYRENSTLVVETDRETLGVVKAGRVDTILLFFQAMIPDEMMRALVGLGPANIDTDFGAGAEYRWVKVQLGGSMTTLSMLLWETGIVGTAIVVLMIVFLMLDAYRVGRLSGYEGTFARIMFAALAIMALALLYANLFHTRQFAVVLALGSALCINLRYQASLQQRSMTGGELLSRNRNLMHVPGKSGMRPASSDTPGLQA